MKESFLGWGEPGLFPTIFPTSCPWPLSQAAQSPLDTQVDMSLPANGDAPHRWEKAALLKVPGTCRPFAF